MKILDANGAKIPALGLGTWKLGGRECSEIVAAALDHGYRHIDTAIMYENEADVGAGISAASVPREEIFLTTKIWPTDLADGDLQKALAGSLKRLNVNYVDLLLIHWPSKTIPFEETFKALDDTVVKEMARHIGVSNFNTSQVVEAIRLTDSPIVCNQVEHHPYLDQTKVRQVCAKHGIALIAYCPLFKAGDLFDEPAIRKPADRHNKSAAQIVLRWHVQQENCGAIPKTATPSRMRENFDIFDFELGEDEMAAISKLSAVSRRLCDFAFGPVWDAA